jgi:hypothetical protein
VLTGIFSNPKTLLASLALAGCFLSNAALAYVSRSGDVDNDQKLTVRDAVMILESRSWPERPGLRAFLSACDYNKDGRCERADADAIFTAIVKDWNDWDGDGVPNASDCALLDERVATFHTYYRDLDKDHFGNPNNSVQLCLTTPPWQLVSWGNDPNDVDQLAMPVSVPKGSRLLALDMGDSAENGRWRDDLARELGAEAVTLNLPWDAVETAPGVYDGLASVLAFYRTTLPLNGLRLSLTVSPLSGNALTLPADLKSRVESGTLRLNEPEVVQRFTALLTQVHAQLAGVDLISLQIGHEIDIVLSQAPQYFWSDYAELLQASFLHAKQLWGPELKVGTTATQKALVTEPSASILRAVNSLTDILSFTYLPRNDQFAVPEPAVVRLDIETVLAAYWPKPLHLQAIGYPSAPLTGSSETRQSQFINAFFDVWDTWGEQIPFVAFGRLEDLSAQRASLDAYGAGPAAAAYYRTLGLRTYSGDGEHKAAYKTLRSLTFNRGWWRMETPATRSFLLGYTPAQYDFPDDGPSFISMMDWIWSAIASDTDMVNLHLDHGVPWVEALSDDLTGSEPPYSESVKSMWSSLRGGIPPGHKLLVSINPLGVPRNVIAPYFGVGQGFVYDIDYNRLPDGAVKDAENRYPPPPWNTYAINDPHVKQAFLNYCKRTIDYFNPDYLIVAIEATISWFQSPKAFGQFIELQSYVYQGLKADPRYAGVPISVSGPAISFMTDEFGVPFKPEEQVPRMRELEIQGLLDLAPFVDILGLSFYPHYGIYNSTLIPPYIFDSLFEVLRMVGKPVGIAESGFPAESFDVFGIPFLSDETKQDSFYRLMLTEFERSPVPVEFLVSFQPRDADLGWARLLAASQQTPPTVSPQFVGFYKYFRDIGLYDGDGYPRPALDTWREHLARPYSPRR